MAVGKNVSDLLTAKFGVRFVSKLNRSLSSVGTTVVQVVRQDPSRIGFTIVNLSLNRIYVSPIGAPSATRGVRIDPNGGSVALNWEEDGEAVAWEWKGIADGAGSNVYILETVISGERAPSLGV